MCCGSLMSTLFLHFRQYPLTAITLSFCWLLEGPGAPKIGLMIAQPPEFTLYSKTGAKLALTPPLGRGGSRLFSVARHDDAGVVSAEPKGVGQRDADVGVPSLAGDVVEITFGVRRREVDGGRDHLVADRQRKDNGLYGARGTHHVAGHRLRAADSQPVGVLAEHAVNSVGLELVVHGSAGPVCVDIVHPLRSNLGFAECPLHREHGAVALGRRGHVEGVVARAVADYLGVDACPTALGVLQLFQQEGSGPFGNHKARTIAIKGARCLGWVLVLREGPHGTKACIDDRDEPGLGSARDDRWRIPPADRLKGLSHSATSGGAGRDHRHVRATQAESDGDMPRRRVDQHVLAEGRADPFQPARLAAALLL